VAKLAKVAKVASVARVARVAEVAEVARVAKVAGVNTWMSGLSGLSGHSSHLTGASNQHLVFALSELAMRCVFGQRSEPSGEIMSTAPHCRVILSCLLISPCRFAFPCLLQVDNRRA